MLIAPRTTIALCLLVAGCGSTHVPPDLDPLAPRSGRVSVWAIAELSSATWEFVDRSEQVFAEGPTERTDGDCTITRWTLDATSPPARRVSVGDITVSATDTCTASSVEETGCSAGNLEIWNQTTTGRLAVAASGGELPPFSAAVDAPSAADSLDAPLFASADEDLEVRWTGGSGVMVVSASLTGAPDGGGGTRRLVVHCEVPMSAGRLVVPASTLREMRDFGPLEGEPEPALGVHIVNRVAIDVGGVPTVVEAMLLHDRPVVR